MFQHVASLKRKLDKLLPDNQKSNFVALGDINTMGMKAGYNDDLDISGAQELGYIDNRMTAGINGMRRLRKTHDNTWWNGKTKPGPSALDHVFAANHPQFQTFGTAEIEVTGWVKETTAQGKKDWIDRYSDHSLLYVEIHD